jgi:hypothetical protein
MNARETKKTAMYSRIYQHAENLNEIFRLGIDGDYAAHIRICKRLRRLEAKAHRIAEQYCNGEIDGDESNKAERAILNSLAKILYSGPEAMPKCGMLAKAIFVNSDPRGYALKIDDEYVKEHALKIHQDWGGYGIIAPDLSEE